MASNLTAMPSKHGGFTRIWSVKSRDDIEALVQAVPAVNVERHNLYPCQTAQSAETYGYLFLLLAGRRSHSFS